jgi:hypothetical protein
MLSGLAKVAAQTNLNNLHLSTSGTLGGLFALGFLRVDLVLDLSLLTSCAESFSSRSLLVDLELSGYEYCLLISLCLR